MAKVPRNRLETFGPELMKILLEGSKRPLKPRPMDWRDAKRFQIRVNGLRSALREAKHPDYVAVARTRCAVFRRNEQDPQHKMYAKYAKEYGVEPECFLVIQPQDIEFRSFLEDMEVTTQPPDPADGDDFLADLTKEAP